MLRLDYDDEPYPHPQEELRTPGAWDKSPIRYNDRITLTGIPTGGARVPARLPQRDRVDRRLLPGKDRQGERHRQRPDDWADEHNDPEYILNLSKRIVTLSVETGAIVNELPPWRIADCRR